MYAMSAKLAFVFLAALTVFVATAERSETSEAYRRFMGFLDRRGCIGPCQKGCGGSDMNCCMYKNTGKRGRCRTVKTWPNYEYMCIHPDYAYVTTNEVINDDCNLNGK